jgi:hypothetical protein
VKFSRVINLGAAAFLLSCVLSNAALLQSVSVLYYLKHLSIIAVAGVATCWWLGEGKATALGRYMLFLAALLVLGLPYLMRFALLGQPLELAVFAQFLIFGVAVVAIGVALERSGTAVAPRIVVLILGSVLAVTLVSGLVNPYLLYNSYWGRPRLLLGFWHPKEVGIMIAAAAVMALSLAILRVRPWMNGVLYLLLVAVLLFVDSRNALLFAVLFGLVYVCAAYVGYWALGISCVAASLAGLWFVMRYPLLADLLMSGRLSVWQSVDYTLLGKGGSETGLGSDSAGVFHMDSYYLGYAAENGIYAPILVLALLLIIAYVMRYTPDRRWRRLKVSAALAFLFVCTFDAGMFSTGNFLNVAVWVYLLVGERIFGSGAVGRVENRRILVPQLAMPIPKLT